MKNNELEEVYIYNGEVMVVRRHLNYLNLRFQHELFNLCIIILPVAPAR